MGKVLIRVRDNWNTVPWKGIVTLQNGNAPAVELPAMEAGTHFLDVRLEQDGKISSFGVFRCGVISPIGTIQITTNKNSYERGENVAGKVLVAHVLNKDATIQLRLEDLPHRKIWQAKTIKLQRGATAINFDFRAVNMPTLAGTIVAQVWQDGRPLAKTEQTAYFPNRQRKIFLNILWDVVPAYRTPIYAKQLVDNLHRSAGLTHPAGDGSVARRTALMNQKFIVYMSRSGLSAGPDGRTHNNNWLSKTKGEIEKATAPLLVILPMFANTAQADSPMLRKLTFYGVQQTSCTAAADGKLADTCWATVPGILETQSCAKPVENQLPNVIQRPRSLFEDHQLR